MNELRYRSYLGNMSRLDAPFFCCCSEIEAKTRAALGQTDINDIYDPVQEDDAIEEPAPEPESLALGAA